MGFQQSLADPSLLVRTWKGKTVYMGVYVDDCLIVSTTEELDEVEDLIRKAGYNIKIEKELSDYLSCSIVCGKGRKIAWFEQLHLMGNLETKFGEEVLTLQSYRTPGTTGSVIVCLKAEDTGILVPKEEATKY